MPLLQLPTEAKAVEDTLKAQAAEGVVTEGVDIKGGNPLDVKRPSHTGHLANRIVFSI